MKFINFGVKRSCFWYVTDFIERMLEVWNKYIDSMCAITFNTMNLLDHTCCTFIVNFFDLLESLLNANAVLGNTYILLSFVSDCYMYFSLGSIQPPNLSQLSFFYKMDLVFFIKSTKSRSFFYQYGYIRISKNRDPWGRGKLSVQALVRGKFPLDKCQGGQLPIPPLVPGRTSSPS